MAQAVWSQPRLSAEDLEQVQVLLDLGYPKTQIAQQFQVSRQTTHNTLQGLQLDSADKEEIPRVSNENEGSWT